MIIARLKFAKRLYDLGLYEVRGVLAWLAGAFASLGVLAALDPAMLPSFMVQYTPHIHDLGKVSLLVGVVAGVVAGQSKKPLPKPPAPTQPSILDDETGQ